MMSRYTTTINDIINHFLPENIRYTDFSLNRLVEETHKQFFNFEYDFYSTDEKLRDKFEKDFLLTYLNEYIGYETLGMFRARLLSHLNTNMYWYTRMFERITEGDNPFENQNENTHNVRDLSAHQNEEKNQGTNSHTSSSDTVNNSHQATTTDSYKQDTESIHSDNPQVTIKTGDYASTMERATEKSSNTNKLTEATQTTGKSGTDFEQKIIDNREQQDVENENNDTIRTGLTGMSRADAIQKYADQIFNLEKMLIDSCKGMFLKVW